MQTTVSIPGLHCEGCAKLIKDVSADFPDIASVEVDLKSKRVTLEHAEHFEKAKWQQEIESLGSAYKVLPA